MNGPFLDRLLFGAALDAAVRSASLPLGARLALSAFFSWLARPLDRRARIERRYDREIAAARRRNFPDTAKRIEAERAEWRAER